MHNGLTVNMYVGIRWRDSLGSWLARLRGSGGTSHTGAGARRPGLSLGVFSTKTYLFWLTSAVDFREHAVTDADFEAGLSADQGSYRAVCGEVFSVCPMVTPPGPACRVCPSSEDYRAQQVARRLAERKHHRRHNQWWRRLARRVCRG